MDYILHIAILVCFYTLLAQSLNFTAGMSGLMSLAQAGFYGIGAYTTAILSTQFGFSFWINLPLAMIIGFVISYLVALIALRTVDDYFIICTLGIQVIIFSLMNNLMLLTKGPLGITDIPPITILNYNIEGKLTFLLLSFIFMISIWYLVYKISKSSFGSILKALNEDEIYTSSIGKDVNKSKIIAFTFGAVLATIPGSLYAHYVSYIDPTSFTISESIFILSIIIIGGLGNFKGTFYAAILMIVLPELLRFIGLPSEIAANIRQIIYGLLLIIIMMNGSNNFLDDLKKNIDNK